MIRLLKFDIVLFYEYESYFLLCLKKYVLKENAYFYFKFTAFLNGYGIALSMEDDSFACVYLIAKCIVYYSCFADGGAVELAVKSRLKLAEDDLGKENRKAARVWYSSGRRR